MATQSRKAKPAKKAKVKDLPAKDAKRVKGGVTIERPRPIYKTL